jgi:NAD(P)-dependent dehydrogenase (short-subunit alcohol dehydrogenase family)
MEFRTSVFELVDVSVVLYQKSKFAPTFPQVTGVPDHALYAGSKAAVEGFTRSFASDCGHKSITVNAIAPGGVKTDMYEQ